MTARPLKYTAEDINKYNFIPHIISQQWSIIGELLGLLLPLKPGVVGFKSQEVQLWFGTLP